MDQRAFQIATRGFALKENKLDCFEHEVFIFQLLWGGIVYF